MPKRTRALTASSSSIASTTNGEPTLEGSTSVEEVMKSEETTLPSAPVSKKQKILEAYLTESPFPSFPHPTHAEARHIHDVLTTAHSKVLRPKNPPSLDENSAKTCGKSRNVIDSLIGVVLSQNTSGKNSSGAKRSLDAAFGRHNFQAIANAPLADVVEALKHGGLANKKAATIQKLLRSIKEKHGDYSLQHLLESSTSNDEAMKELLSYDGIGPKTASCVLLFCLGRESFAVDTHVFRLSKVLGWVPEKVKNDRVKAQAHLDLKIPDELKYGLHVLMIRHGKTCKGCRNGGEKDCILKEAKKAPISEVPASQ
jgi:endonuclease-3